MRVAFRGLYAGVALLWVAATSPAHALVVGAGQSVTFNFDFSSQAAAIAAATQPLTLTFSVQTSASDKFDSPAGIFSYQYLDIGAVPQVNFGYDATGGLTSLGLLSLSVSTLDLTGGLRISPVSESIDLIGATFSAQDFVGSQVISPTALVIPETVDVQVPEPPAALLLLTGLAAVTRLRRRRS